MTLKRAPRGVICAHIDNGCAGYIAPANGNNWIVKVAGEYRATVGCPDKALALLIRLVNKEFNPNADGVV